LRHQPVHLVSAPEQPSAHVELKRIELLDLRVMLVVEAEIDASACGETNEEPNRAFVWIEEGIPDEQ